MRTTLNIKDIQYMNIFERATGIKARCCFEYDSMLFFLVQRDLVRIASSYENMNRLFLKTKRRIKIIPMPEGIQDIDFFIHRLLPNKIKNIEIQRQDNNISLIIYSAPKTKATIIGKNKVKFIDLSKILNDFFDVKKVIIK